MVGSLKERQQEQGTLNSKNKFKSQYTTSSQSKPEQVNISNTYSYYRHL